MNGQKEPTQRFFDYPKPLEGPHVPYDKADDENPAFRGTLLVIGAWLLVFPSPKTNSTNFTQRHETSICSEDIVQQCWLQQSPQDRASRQVRSTLECESLLLLLQHVTDNPSQLSSLSPAMAPLRPRSWTRNPLQCCRKIYQEDTVLSRSIMPCISQAS